MSKEDRFDNLKYGVDAITGEVLIPKKFNGILDAVKNSGREYTYMAGSFTLKAFKQILYKMNPFHSFDDLFQFNHFDAMPDFETASTIDKILYSIARESEIKTMKRLRAYVGYETDFYLNN